MFLRILRPGAAVCFAALLFFSCGDKSGDGALDPVVGVVSSNLLLSDSLLLPDSIALESDYEKYYLADKFLFLGESEGQRYALLMSYERALQDNRFKRAERVFEGYLLTGSHWQVLGYTRAQQVEERLDDIGDYYFATMERSTDHRSGTIRYDRRETKFEFSFADLKPVQGFRQGETKRRVNAIGSGSLTIDSATITGTVFYQLVQLEGFNPIAGKGVGIDYINFDWIGLLAADGERILASADSTTRNDLLLKNFVSIVSGDSILFADGSANFRIKSDLIRRDPKITDYLALKKNLTAPELDFELNLDLTQQRLFYTSGFCLALVEGQFAAAAGPISVWGVLEHRQKPKSSDQALR